jgi:ABC-2 type transport system ATP-binding protein
MNVQRTNDSLVVEAHGLGKRYGDRWVLRDVDLAIPRGSVLGLLGPNGAGKTTAVRILTTLLAPDSGTATVAGFDVARQARRVRPLIGLASQEATVDRLLSGRANLELTARLHRLSRRDARARADELLQRFNLVEAADDLARTYSGGMRRRLDLAATLVADPVVLFLDEPTTGLDPRSRNELWDELRGLVDGGTTLVLTTQYLEEADRLADHVAVVDHGRIVAEGSPDELKHRVGGSRVVLGVADEADLGRAAEVLERLGTGVASVDAQRLEVAVPVTASTGLADAVRALDAAGIAADDIALRRASLDDVFLTLTGHDATEREAA